jgi:hypothetical protein
MDILRPSRALLLLLCLASVGVAHSADSSAESTAPELTARWLTSCEAGEQGEYLVIKVFSDGSVQYVGGTQAKEQGERTVRIKPQDAHYLGRRGADFIRAPSAGRRTSRPETCMEFAARVDGKVRTRRESIETRASKVFANDIARKLPLLQWACPARAAASVNPADPQLSLAAFCAKWPDSSPRAGGER